MPQHNLTDRFCSGAKSTEVQTDYFDEGHPGLALRVGRSGSKNWCYLFTLGGKRQRMTLGTYPATSLKRARTLADEARASLKAGHDPRTVLAKPDTLRSVCEEWGFRESARLRTGAERHAILVRLVYPTLGARPISEIRRSDIVRLLDTISDERGPAMADRTLAILRSILNWYASRSDDFHSPIVRGMARIKSRERARSRILTDDELRLVWSVAGNQGAFGRLIRFLLLTGARRSEAAEMKWIELDGADWLLPAARNKTKLDLLRPLSAQAMTVLGPRPDDVTWVFTIDGVRALQGFSELKSKFDRAMPEVIPDWRLHDLRRTSRSLMSRAGVPTDHAERVLGHVIGGVRAVYDRHDFRDEKAEALAKLARQIDRIISGRPTVLTLRRVERAND